jgi:Tfp pilus assembly protein PilF
MKYFDKYRTEVISMFHGRVVFLTVLFLLLQGCAIDQPKIIETKQKSATKVIVVTPEARSDFETAMGFIKAEEYEKGIEALKKVTKALPENAVAHINLALAYKKLGKFKEAEESLKLAIVADPDNPVANNELALLYRKTGKFKEARQIYEKTLEKYPDFNMVHKNLGILCDIYLKDYQCALNQYVIYSSAVQDDKTVKIWIADTQNRMRK